MENEEMAVKVDQAMEESTEKIAEIMARMVVEFPGITLVMGPDDLMRYLSETYRAAMAHTHQFIKDLITH